MEGPSKLTIYLILSGLPEFCLHLSLLSTRILVNFIQFSQYSSLIWMKESNSRVFVVVVLFSSQDKKYKCLFKGMQVR